MASQRPATVTGRATPPTSMPVEMAGGPVPGSPASSRSSLALRALEAYAQRSPATQSDVDQVMRALVSHDGWFVPVSFAEKVWGQTAFEQTLMLGEVVEPQPVLNVFTDADAALLAQGQGLGLYGGPVLGATFMRALGPDIEALIVNRASPREHQWFISAMAFEIAAAWATAIAVEEALAHRGNGPVPARDLLEHRFHVLLERSSRAVAQIFLPDIEGVVAVCFTATDRAEEFIASLPRETRPQAEIAPVNGPQMFEMMRDLGVSGLVVNAGSDDQTALTRDDILEVIASRAAYVRA